MIRAGKFRGVVLDAVDGGVVIHRLVAEGRVRPHDAILGDSAALAWPARLEAGCVMGQKADDTSAEGATARHVELETSERFVREGMPLQGCLHAKPRIDREAIQQR